MYNLRQLSYHGALTFYNATKTQKSRFENQIVGNSTFRSIWNTYGQYDLPNKICTFTAPFGFSNCLYKWLAPIPRPLGQWFGCSGTIR